MTGQLTALEGRWGRIGMTLVAVAFLSPSILQFSILPALSPPPALANAVPTRSGENLPAGLEAAISATLDKAYLISSADSGLLEAHNSRQDLKASFSAEGVVLRPPDGQWSFDLSVSRFGRQGELFSVASSEPFALGTRVAYERGLFIEWYENRPEGIEQGFTLPIAPPGEGLVELEMRWTESLSADLSPDARSVAFSDSDGTIAFRYQDLVVYDAEGQELSAHLELGRGTISLLVDDRRASYPLTVDPLVVTEQAHLLASDGAAGDSFGFEVALAGDTALVGAFQDDTAGGVNAGSAYVFVRSGTTWTEQAHLFASDGAAEDWFGLSVALAGDTALIGAFQDDTASGVNAGSVYVFVRSGITWTEQAHLFASDGAPEDHFGVAVALAGDTALVGARGDDTAGGVNAGSAYVFVRSGTSWTEQAHLFASDGAFDDSFGQSVALAGDTALVGAVSDTTPGGGGGSVYVFVRSGITWTEQAHLFASDGAPGDQFGVAVALAGDTALVGASADDTGRRPQTRQTNAGSAYVFVRSGTTWTEQAHLFASDGAFDDSFGQSVALADDTALVGAHEDDTAGGERAGSAYVFVRSGTSWTEQAHLFASDAAAGDLFGFSVALAGDTALVGAFGHDTAGGVDAGLAYVFVINPASSCTITGTAGNDVLTGTSGDDVICGLGGNDSLSGLGGNDTLLGGDGRDSLVGGIGTNTLDGGTGTDSATYSWAFIGVTANLASGTATGPATDTLVSIENLDGSNSADSLTGDSGSNALRGLTGNDSLDGGAGTDTLNGGPGTDTCVNGETVNGCEL